MRREHGPGKREAGFVVSTELVLIAVLVVIGLVIGLAAIRDATTAELGDVAEAFGALDQSYIYDGNSDFNANAAVAGSAWSDTADNGSAGSQGYAGDELGFNFNVVPDTDEDTQVPPVP